VTTRPPACELDRYEKRLNACCCISTTDRADRQRLVLLRLLPLLLLLLLLLVGIVAIAA